MKTAEGLRLESDEGDLDRTILELLRGEEASVSGGKLAARLGVSRTAVWKRILSLREGGFDIEALPARGYRLLSSPRSLLHPAAVGAGLGTARIGSRIVSHSLIASTNTEAYRLAEAGAPEGTVVIAGCQSGGKGRMGRSWESPAGVNLYLSVVLRPPVVPLLAPQLTFASAVAVARTVEATTVLRPEIKWPNDLLVNGRKVAGLLNEMSAETDRISFVILGIGVNLNMTAEQFPPDLRYPASSLLLEEGAAVDRLAFTRRLLLELDATYSRYLGGGYDDIRSDWLSLCSVCGKRVKVTGAGAERSGTVTGVDEMGALLLRVAGGRTETIYSGDVTPVEE